MDRIQPGSESDFQRTGGHGDNFGCRLLGALAGIGNSIQNRAEGNFVIDRFGLGCCVVFGVLALGLINNLFWYDEVFTLAVAGLPLGRMFMALAGDVHPPLFYLIEWFNIRLFGPGALRLPAFLFGLGAWRWPGRWWGSLCRGPGFAGWRWA